MLRPRAVGERLGRRGLAGERPRRGPSERIRARPRRPASCRIRRSARRPCASEIARIGIMRRAVEIVDRGDILRGGLCRPGNGRPGCPATGHSSRSRSPSSKTRPVSGTSWPVTSSTMAEIGRKRPSRQAGTSSSRRRILPRWTPHRSVQIRWKLCGSGLASRKALRLGVALGDDIGHAAWPRGVRGRHDVLWRC